MSECTKIDDMYMENLEEWVLEDDKVVTYKYLSKNLKVHVNVAKQMLFNFVQSQKNKLGVVYLLSGLVTSDHGDNSADIGTQQKVVLVKEADLDRVKAKFTEVLSQHIYSVQKSSESVSVTSLFGADKPEHGQDVTAGASLASIKHKAAVPREGIIRAPPVVKQEIKSEPIVKKEEKKDSVKKGSGIEAVVKKPSPVKTETTKPVTKDKGKTNIANMFAKQSTKPKPTKSETATEEKENIVNQKIEESKVNKEEKKEKKEKKEVTRFGKIVEETNTKRKSKSDSQKRKRIQVMSDSEDDDDNDQEEDEEENPVAEPEAAPVTKLIESDDEDIPATPVTKSVKSGRKRVKKQVDKTFMDEKGYMVTKKVYESASETDDESSEPAKVPTPKKQEKVEPPASKKAKITGSGGKGQTGIMSFFKKK